MKWSNFRRQRFRRQKKIQKLIPNYESNFEVREGFKCEMQKLNRKQSII